MDSVARTLITKKTLRKSLKSRGFTKSARNHLMKKIDEKKLRNNQGNVEGLLRSLSGDGSGKIQKKDLRKRLGTMKADSNVNALMKSNKIKYLGRQKVSGWKTLGMMFGGDKKQTQKKSRKHKYKSQKKSRKHKRKAAK